MNIVTVKVNQYVEQVYSYLQYTMLINMSTNNPIKGSLVLWLLDSDFDTQTWATNARGVAIMWEPIF